MWLARARTLVSPLFSERDRVWFAASLNGAAHKVHVVVAAVAVVVRRSALSKITTQWEACKQWLRGRRLAALSSSRPPPANRRAALRGADGKRRRTVQYPSVPLRGCTSSIQ